LSESFFIAISTGWTGDQDGAATAASDDNWTYIDAYYGGERRTRLSCPALAPHTPKPVRRESYHAVAPSQVLERMALNLIHCSHRQSSDADELHFYRLASLLKPGDWALTRAYAQLCDFLGLELEQAVAKLESVLEAPTISSEPHWLASTMVELRDKCRIHLEEQRQLCRSLRPRRRRPRDAEDAPAPVEFCVGQVLRHRIFAYQCVVIDWERRCSAPDDWCRRMGVHQLRHGVDQPFYHVLVEGHRSALYVPQELLQLDERPDGVDHAEVGRHFHSFDGRRYVANDEASAQFPDDETFYQSRYARVASQSGALTC